MAFDGETYRISIAETHALPEQEFRDLFCAAIGELIYETAPAHLISLFSMKAGPRAI